MTRADRFLGAVLTLAGLLEAAGGLTGDREPWWVLVTVPLATAPVAVRRTHTSVAVGMFVGACLIQSALGSDLPGGLTEFVALVLFAYAVGGSVPLRVALMQLTGLAVGMSTVVLVAGDARPGNFVYLATVLTASWTAGYAVRMTRERGELAADQALLAERSRIAGELHDVVAHHVSAIVVQAAAERRDAAPGSAAADALTSIEAQGRETLSELRALLGVLHAADATPLAPQPGIGDLADLVRSAADAGVTVTVRSEGSPRPVGAAAGLTVYRVVQEALTNVRKHSAGATATVSLRWLPDHLDLDVHDPGPTRRSPRFAASGLGLWGMAERVRAHGGSVDAGVDGRGFRVRATVPVEGSG